MARASLLRLFQKEAPRADSRLDTLCEFAPAQGTQEELVFWFLELVGWVRPHDNQRVEPRLRYLAAQLERHPEWRANVARALTRLVESCDVTQFLSSAGIPRDFHLAGALLDWALARTLPAACNTTDATQIVTMAFRPSDVAWLRRMAGASWLLDLVDSSQHDSLRDALARSLVDLVHEIVSQAHSAGLRGLSDLQRSPFSGLFAVVNELNRNPTDVAAARALAGRAQQCLRAVEAQRVGLAERGASLNTTFLLLRLRRQLRRLIALASLRHDPSPERLWATLGELSEEALRGTTGGRLLRGSSHLVVQNLVDTTAAVGRDYLEPDRSSVWAAFRAGAGGGALMAIATATKFLLGQLHLPKLYQGLAYASNYATVFAVAYLLHYTIATKLPAHTAAALARELQQGRSFRGRLARFTSTWRAMVRLQLWGLLGNVLSAAPLAAVIAYAFSDFIRHPLLSRDKAEQVLQAQSLLGPSLLFAACTGVMLWISSVVGAFVDNWARVTRLSERLATNVHALRNFSPTRARERAEQLTRKVGGMASNITLGLLLGGVPTAFALAELPVEIRHVTVSVSSVAMAAVAGASGSALWGWALAGVAMIGITNVVVSFSIAIWFALASARDASAHRSAGALLVLGIRRWLGGASAEGRTRSAVLAPPVAQAVTPVDRAL